MANLRTVRKRIASVKGTQKLTRAMKLVASAKLRKAQDNLLRMRPYARKVLEAASTVASRLEEEDHPLLSRREGNRRLVLVLTSDKGLCGGFNANILRRTEQHVERLCGYENARIAVAGKKGINYFRSRRIETQRQYADFYDNASFDKASEISTWFVDEFTKEHVDGVDIIYNEFKSAASQDVVVEEFLPIRRAALEDQYRDLDYIFEPDKEKLLDKLLGMYAATEIYRAVMESTASEQGARMTAMENATKNAEEMIRDLTLEYNKARQYSITKELLEIVGGKEAQKAG